MTEPASLVAFVTGATGHQGGATAHQLLNAGVQVRVLARDTSSKAAIDLQTRGARLFRGDFDNIPSLTAAMAGASAIFLNVSPNPHDTSRKVAHANNVIDAANVSGAVTTIVYSSVAMTGKHETFPNWGAEYPMAWYWTNKAQIESMVRNAAFKYWTILRPAFLMNNYLQPTVSSMFPQLAKKRTLLTAYNPETSMTVIDPGDVGKFAAAAILEPLDFHGHEIDLGAESLKPAELVRELSLASGKDITLEFYSQDEAKRLAVNDGRLQA